MHATAALATKAMDMQRILVAAESGIHHSFGRACLYLKIFYA